LKFYRVRSEAYFRRSEIFVNRRDYGGERSPYPVDWGNVGRREHHGIELGLRNYVQVIVEKLRMSVDILAGAGFARIQDLQHPDSHYLGYVSSVPRSK
jgi:hypothetical protein